MFHFYSRFFLVLQVKPQTKDVMLGPKRVRVNVDVSVCLLGLCPGVVLWRHVEHLFLLEL